MYEVAQEEAEEFANILYMMQQYEVESVAELIRKQPREAYVNGIFHNYDSDRVISEEESKVLAKAYFILELEKVEETLEDIRELDGDYEYARELLAGVVNYCTKNKR